MIINHVILCGSLTNFNFVPIVVTINHFILYANLTNFFFFFTFVFVHLALFISCFHVFTFSVSIARTLQARGCLDHLDIQDSCPWRGY